MFEDNAMPEADLLFHVVFDVELELILLAFGSGSEDADVCSVLVTFVLDQCLLQLVVELEVAGREDLEDCIPVIFEVQNIVAGLILHLYVCKALCREQSLVLSIGFEAFDEYALSEPEIGVVFLLRHQRYILINK